MALVAILLILPGFVFWAARLEMGTTFVESWLPGGDEDREAYRSFRRRFGDDQFLLISWEKCRLGDPKLESFTQRLESLAQEKPDLVIESVNHSGRVLVEMEASEIDPQSALNRLQGVLIGDDGEALIQVQLREGEVELRAELIASVRRIASEVLAPEDGRLVLAGEPFQIQEIDRSSRDAIAWFVPPSMVLALTMAWFCVRDLPQTLTVLAYAGIGQLIGMAVISFFLGEMIAVLVVLPTLVFMLTLSAAVHLSSYFADAGGNANPNSGALALRRGMTPCVLATVTTVFGFGSLVVSQLAPVWHFGSLAATSLIIASIITLSTFPASALIPQWIATWIKNLKQRGPRRELCESRHSSPENRETVKATSSGENPLIAALVGFTSRWSTLLVILGFALLSFSFAGIGKLQSSTEFEDMFPADSDAVLGLNWIRDEIGPINALEFLVTLPPKEQSGFAAEPNAAALVDELQLLGRLERALKAAPSVNSTISAGTFLPPAPSGAGVRNTIVRAVYQKKVLAQLDEFSNKGLLWRKDGVHTWRITARVAGLRGDNYVSIREQLESALGKQVEEEQRSSNRSISIELTGLRALVERAHHALISDLVYSFVAAFGLITPVMMLIVRGVMSGLVLMIPNVLPVAFVFGCMGWFGVALDVASVLTASVALGIAVDDTLHFVTWYFRGRRRGLDASEATKMAIQTCTRPIIHTTLISTAAMAPFFLSEFLPTSKFALLMILILAGAIIGDLILLPAFLQSPFGRWIGSQYTPRPATEEGTDASS
ncbi:MAG: efflux RND transporter permease subunit [Aureliella sp.]